MEERDKPGREAKANIICTLLRRKNSITDVKKKEIDILIEVLNNETLNIDNGELKLLGELITRFRAIKEEIRGKIIARIVDLPLLTLSLFVLVEKSVR